MSSTADNLFTESIPSLESLTRDIDSLEGVVENWDEQQRLTVEALIRAHDDLNKEAFRRLIQSLKVDPAAATLLMQAVSDEVIYAVLRHHEIVKPSLNERIEAALDSVRPSLESHGGNVEVVNINPPNSVEIRLLGACDGCPASSLTLSEGVEKAIQEYCPEITEIKKAKGGISAKPADVVPVNFISPFARNDDSDWLRACLLEEVPEGDIKVLTLNSNEIILSRFDNKVTCYQNACAHLGLPLDMGEISNGILICPHHGFKYSLESGECLTAPEVQLQTHAVRVMDNHVEVRLS